LDTSEARNAMTRGDVHGIAELPERQLADLFGEVLDRLLLANPVLLGE
jgi:hypothetical protein